MKDWGIIAIGVALIILGWLLRIGGVNGMVPGWMIGVGLILFGLSLYNLLKHNK